MQVYRVTHNTRGGHSWLWEAKRKKADPGEGAEMLIKRYMEGAKSPWNEAVL
jgi:hypothetical protein